MKPSEYNTDIAGLDIGKLHLDASLASGDEHQKFANKGNDFEDLLGWLRRHQVVRIGMEATGGYEHEVAVFLIEHGFEVIIHQPLEIKRFAQFMRIRAKNDKIDAKVIALATAAKKIVPMVYHADLSELSEMMTLYEHFSSLLAKAKTFSERLRLETTKAYNDAIKAELTKAKKDILVAILKKLRGHKYLNQRYELLKSLPGIGPLIAASLTIRMPELGTLAHGKAAALLGSAPLDRDSGTFKGKRTIFGGRARPRRHMYIAALSAMRMTKSHFKPFADRLKINGKPIKVIIIAVMRKLIEAANLVLQRQSPWVTTCHTLT
ncbi:conserved hypothetical protein [Crenothrix polyspora]|uniref:Uncharacterized protein n=1 Tax=Crenothrix polyspora TaxID=360316 RepID=A0A1R4H6S4_9GAMM|nr:IS110 family transposase [Crenothrix polyspora]SJM91952.1 conserved hypothetical protein [Crenothrix polyspora]